MPTWDEAAALEIIAASGAGEGGLLATLHALQARAGYVDERAVRLLAEAFNRSRAEVAGVVSFYTDFRSEPPGRHVIKLCRAEACQARGCERVAAELEARLAIRFDTTTPDGAVTLETVYCLGNCALGPAALVDGKLYGRLDADGVCARLRP